MLDTETVLKKDVDEAAHLSLLRKLAAIPGIRVCEQDSTFPGQSLIQVCVEENAPGAEEAVYRAELEVHQLYPGARLELFVV